MSILLSTGCRQLHFNDFCCAPKAPKDGCREFISYVHEIMLHLDAGGGALLVLWVAEGSGRRGMRPALCTTRCIACVAHGPSVTVQ